MNKIREQRESPMPRTQRAKKPMALSTHRLERRGPAARAAGLLSLTVLIATATLGAPSPARAKVFTSQRQAIAEAFPEATRVERRTFVLRPEQSERIAEIIGTRADAKVVVLHVAFQDDRAIGYAEIAVHKVRTQPEAMLIAISPQGRVQSVRIIAFHEPLDYMPTARWYSQFVGKGKGDRLNLGREIHGVVGATLSAQAAVDAVRRILAYWEVLLLPAYGPGEAP
jgi:Na+-translocating ferredoxin:NAD+ oxidoreductase RnfG subunit